ncbi:Hypothetical_protein [Hexamita inflata]|uniref:Hypothetical_protein n=1 Tax=Hexamita inflata TaxID=28002 RepID=A0AA86UVC2_9EUKA|nr:Hypothetical protein HINF_LOCUS60885 [Hexamita inflata]
MNSTTKLSKLGSSQNSTYTKQEEPLIQDISNQNDKIIMPCVLINQIITKIFAIISGVCCIVQYILKLVQSVKNTSKFTFITFQSWIISLSNITFGIILIISVCLPSKSSVKDKFRKYLRPFCDPLICCCITFYLLVAQAPPQLFSQVTKIEEAQSAFLVLGTVGCALMLIFGLQRICDTQSAKLYYKYKGVSSQELKDFKLEL